MACIEQWLDGLGTNVESEEYLTSQILTYLGNKRSLLRYIGEGIVEVKKALGRSKLSFFDGFSGSGIVARYMKQHASLIIANDLERYSEIVNRCYLTNKSDIDLCELSDVFDGWVAYTNAHLKPGIIAQHYSPQDDHNIKIGERVFYTNRNAILIDSARVALEKVVPKKYFELLLAPLLAEASIHPNTSGVFKGFYKNKKGIGAFGGEGKNAIQRICGNIELRTPVLSNFNCESQIIRGDTNEVVKGMDRVDLAYFDPPYNQHPYGSNYFMLNVIADYVMPTNLSRVSGIPEGWNHSRYNVKKEAEETFFDLIANTPAKYLMLSYNSEGFIGRERFVEFLNKIGRINTIEIEYNTFRGCRNLNNRPLKVTEYLFVVKKHN